MLNAQTHFSPVTNSGQGQGHCECRKSRSVKTRRHQIMWEDETGSSQDVDDKLFSDSEDERKDSQLFDTKKEGLEEPNNYNAKGEEFIALDDCSTQNFKGPNQQNNSQLDMTPVKVSNFEENSYEPSSWEQIRQDTIQSSYTNLDQSFSKSSVYSDSGVSMYTSTPIKHRGDVDNDLHNDPKEISSSSVNSVTPVDSNYTLTGYSASSSQSSSSLQVENISDEIDSLSQILDEGDEEFRIKYSSWISQLFHLQLTKIHRRLNHHYHRKMEQLTRAKQKEIQEIQEKYMKKLNELESQADKFRIWIETLSEENKRIKKTKQVIVDEMNKSSAKSKHDFQVELERQINLVQAECEKEKLELNKKHGQQLKIFLDKSCSQIEKVDSDYKEQMEALNIQVYDLQIRNENLEEQVRTLKRLSTNPGPNSLRPPASSGSYCFRREKEHLLSVIQELKNKLYDADKEKATLLTEYEEKLLSLKEDFYRHDKELIKQLDGSQRNFETLHQAHENEIRKYQAKLIEQDTSSQEIIAKLREKYGEKIKSLTDMVETLQREMGSTTKEN